LLAFRNTISDDGLKHFRQFPNLLHLSLEDTAVTDKGAQYIRDNLKLEGLTLGTSQCRITEAGLSFLPKQLKWVSVRGPNFTDASVEHIVKLPNVESVHLMDTRLTNTGIQRLVGAKPALTLLYIERIQVDDDVLPVLGKLKNLQELRLDDLPISDKNLSSLHGLKKLQRLSLKGTRVTMDGVRALRLALPSCSIESDVQ
jgi:hypothetical protein